MANSLIRLSKLQTSLSTGRPSESLFKFNLGWLKAWHRSTEKCFLYISELRTILSYTHTQEPHCPDKRGSTVLYNPQKVVYCVDHISTLLVHSHLLASSIQDVDEKSSDKT